LIELAYCSMSADLAGGDHVRRVGEVRVEDVVHLAAGQLGVERRRVVARVRVVALDGDVRVELLEGLDVGDPVGARLRL
jgi:hypothetical protein